jgi:hypothetical protein
MQAPAEMNMSIAPHLIAAAASEPAITVKIAGNSGAKLAPELVQELVKKGLRKEIAEVMTVEEYEAVGKQRKNTSVKAWKAKKSALEGSKAIQHEQALPVHEVLKSGSKKEENNMAPKIDINAIADQVLLAINAKLSAKQETFAAKPIAKTDGKKSPEVAVRELIAKINQRKVKAGKTYTFQDGTVDKGVHAVWDGYNASLRAYYGEDMDVVAFTSALETAGIVKVVPAKGGAKVYLADDYQPKKNVNIISL